MSNSAGSEVTHQPTMVETFALEMDSIGIIKSSARAMCVVDKYN